MTRQETLLEEIAKKLYPEKVEAYYEIQGKCTKCSVEYYGNRFNFILPQCGICGHEMVVVWKRLIDYRCNFKNE